MTSFTHSAKLERWLGTETVEGISRQMRDWYGPPIAVANVPGSVFACRGGDFIGPIRGGGLSSAFDFYIHRLQRIARDFHRRQRSVLGAGFGSLSELISEMSVGKKRDFFFQKVGVAGSTGYSQTLWFSGNLPAAGAAAAAAPGGTVPTDATTGAFPFDNPTGGDTMHFIGADALATVAANTLLLYDRLFAVTKTMNSTSTEAVTGVPTRYQSTTSTDANYAGGNFLAIECRTVLSATAHNWTTCLYTDQSGNAGVTLPSVTGVTTCPAQRLDQLANSFFCPLATNDTGIAALTQMQCSALVTSGAVDFIIGHPIAFLPCPVASMICIRDGINSAINLTRIFDDACLAFLEVIKPSSTATTYSGSFTTAWS